MLNDDDKLNWELHLNQLLESKKQDNIDKIFEVFEIVLGRSTKNNDMSNLYKLIGVENFLKVLKLYDGKTVKYETLNNLEDSILLSLLFYYKEIKKLNWDKIKEKVPVKFSAYEYGMKISHLNKYIKNKLKDILEELDNE